MRKAFRKRFSRHGSEQSSRSSRSTSPLPPVREIGGHSTPVPPSSKQSINQPAQDPLFTKECIWSLAYEKLRETEPELLTAFETILQDDCLIPPGASAREKLSIAVATKKSAMIDKQWMIRFMNQKIKIREQIHRIVKVVQTAQALGSAVASLDPLHAGLPWAGVCVILTIILNDSKQNAAALDGLEEVNSLIARYAAIENFYLQRKDLTLKAEFRVALIALYAKVLGFQATAACHFSRNTIIRTIRSTFQLEDWIALLQDINLKDAACQKMASIFDSTDLRSEAFKSQEILREHDLKLQVILDDLHLLHENNVKTLLWFSEIQYRSDHDHIMHELGTRYQNSGQWLLQRAKQWRNGEGTSPFMWLCGTVGTGKSSLVSVVIQDLTPPINKTDDVLAYFYCSQKQYGRTDSTDILRCLVSQLAWSKDGVSIAQPVKTMYDSRGRDRLSGGGEPTLEECVDLIIDLINLWTRAIIVIDALDECSNAPEVLVALQDIQKRSPAGLKIFVSSRMNIDVLYYLPDCEKVQVDEGMNFGDIEVFVRSEVVNQQRRLLDNKRPDLEARLIQVLVTRAQGMFMWVKLQLLTFFSPKSRLRLSKDVENMLDLLEKDTTLQEINSVYEQILDMNTRPGTHDRTYAMRTLQWILCAIENLPIEELAKAVSIDSNGRFDSEVDGPLLLEICSNLIVLTEFNTCRFAHLSVGDFLLLPKGFRNAAGGLYTEAQINAEVAENCLSYIINNNLIAADSVELHRAESGFRLSTSTILDQVERSIGDRESSNVANLNSNYRAKNISSIPTTKASDPTQQINSESNFSAPTDSVHMSRTQSNSDVAPDPDRSQVNSFERSFHSYALFNWAFHCGLAGEFRNGGSLGVLLERFLKHDPPASAFVNWNETILKIVSNERDSNKLSNDVYDIRDGTVPGRIKGVVAFPPCAAFVASAFGILEVLERMTGSEINDLRGMHGETCLHFAALGGQVDAIRLLLPKIKGGIALQDNAGETALYKADCFGHHAVIEILLQWMGASDFSQVDRKGKTALHEAAYFGSRVAVSLLLGKMSETDVALQDVSGRTALHQAVNGQSEGVVSLILENMNHKDISLQDMYGETALHMAASQDGQIVSLLVDHMTPEAIALRNYSGETVIHKANRAQEEDVLRPLFAKIRSKDLALQDQHGNMVLHEAVSPYTTRFMVSSLVMGMDLDDLGVQNDEGETVLHRATAQPSNGNVISLLLALMSPNHITLQDRSGKTALYNAIDRQDDATMEKLLLKLKPEDLGVQADDGSTILHWAVSRYKRKRRMIDSLEKSPSRKPDRNVILMEAHSFWRELGNFELVMDRMRPEDIALRDMDGHTAFEVEGGFAMEAEKTQLLQNWGEELGLERAGK